MRIGLFTDTYFPTTNGITFVVDILRRNLIDLGHEVWVFAPEPRMHRWIRRKEPGIIRFPAIEGIFFDEQLTSFFFPALELKKITELQLDVIMLFTPAQVGLMGAYAAATNGIVLIEQYCTDLISYAKQYPAVMPGVIALLLSMPVTMRARPKELLRLTKQLTRNRDRSLTRSQDSVKHILNMLHDRCDLLITVSEKSAQQLASYHVRTPIAVLPTGVDVLPSSAKSVQAQRARWKVSSNDTVCLYVGRLGIEKNIELLLRSFHKLCARHNNIKLVLVGGFSHGETLKQLAVELGIEKRVIFTGRIDRGRLGPIYESADIFCFPSVTDTQALVLNEAAHAGLPIVWCDENINDVAIDGISGIKAHASVRSFSDALEKLINDPGLRRRYGKSARTRARQLTELRQTKKLIKLFEQYI